MFSGTVLPIISLARTFDSSIIPSNDRLRDSCTTDSTGRIDSASLSRPPATSFSPAAPARLALKSCPALYSPDERMLPHTAISTSKIMLLPRSPPGALSMICFNIASGELVLQDCTSDLSTDMLSLVQIAPIINQFFPICTISTTQYLTSPNLCTNLNFTSMHDGPDKLAPSQPVCRINESTPRQVGRSIQTGRIRE
jgi:hypothetical protein